MTNTKKPTPEELKRVEAILEQFNKRLQDSAVFNEPLSSSERAITKTLLLWLVHNEYLDVSDQEFLLC